LNDRVSNKIVGYQMIFEQLIYMIALIASHYNFSKINETSN